MIVDSKRERIRQIDRMPDRRRKAVRIKFTNHRLKTLISFFNPFSLLTNARLHFFFVRAGQKEKEKVKKKGIYALYDEQACD